MADQVAIPISSDEGAKELNVGLKAVIHGLEKAKDFNDREGLLLAWVDQPPMHPKTGKPLFEGRGRWLVQVCHVDPEEEDESEDEDVEAGDAEGQQEAANEDDEVDPEDVSNPSMAARVSRAFNTGVKSILLIEDEVAEQSDDEEDPSSGEEEEGEAPKEDGSRPSMLQRASNVVTSSVKTILAIEDPLEDSSSEETSNSKSDTAPEDPAYELHYIKPQNLKIVVSSKPDMLDLTLLD